MTINQHKAILFAVLFSLFTMNSNAQTEQSQILRNYKETIWLNSDRHLYLSGETLTFQAILLEKDSYKASKLSHAMRIELIDTDGNKLIKTNLEVADSQIRSSFFLPPDMKTGWYYIRAYTNWMRNFPAKEFGLLRIKIVNPADENPAPSETDPAKSLTKKNNLDSEHNKESGSAENIYISDDNESNNLSVTISKLNPDTITIVKLLVHQSYSWYWFDKKPLNGTEVSFELPKSDLPTGIMQFTVLSDNNTVISRKLWSGYKPENTANNNCITLTNSNLQLRTNYKAKYNITHPTLHNPRSAGRTMIPGSETSIRCLIAVREPAPPYETNLPGLPGWSAGAMIPRNKQAFKNWLNAHHYTDDIVNAFLLTKSGDPISLLSVNRAQSPDLSGIRYLPETRSGVISGRVIDKNTKAPVPSVLLALTILNNKHFEASRTNDDGLFHFEFPDINSSLDYILNFTSEPDPSWVIEVTPEYDKRISQTDEPAFTLSTEELEFLRQMNINDQLKKAYAVQTEKAEQPPDSAAANTIFYYPPDYTIKVNDYIKLANVREVIYEVVPNVNVRTVDDRQLINFYFKNPVSAAYETLVLLDGIAITSYDELLILPPDRIKSIDVKNKIFIHGKNIFSAIINFISQNGDFAGLDLTDKAILSSVDLPLMNNNYQLPDVNTAEPNIPVLNNILLWKTHLNPLSGTIDFTTNDLAGEFQISIYGFDENEQWVFSSRRVTVGLGETQK